MLPESFFIVNYALTIAFTVIAIAISSITVIITLTHRSCRNFTNLLTCNTCVGVSCYFLVRFSTTILALRDDWASYQPACIFRAYTSLAFCAVFSYSYMFHALSRFFCVVCVKYRFLSTWRSHWILILINWMIALIIPIVPYFYPKGFDLEVESRSCIVNPKILTVAVYSVLGVFITPLNLMLMIYSHIFFHIRRSTRRVMTVPATTNLPNSKREFKLMMRVLIQAGLLAFGGLLYLIVVIWHVIDPDTLPDSLYLLSVSIISIFSSIMIFTAFLMNKKMKKILLDFCFKRTTPMAFERSLNFTR